MSKIIQGKFKILSNKKVGPGYWKMVIAAPEIARAASPGQFVHLLCQAQGPEPLLRRPFSFHRIGKDRFQILYQAIGRGTKLLAQRKKGERIDVLGPLGTGFEIVLDQTADQILVAGGMGVAPLVALAEKLNKIHRRSKTLVLIGARTKKELLCANEFKKLGCQVQIATDDGTHGYKGLITDLVKKVLKLLALNSQLCAIYSCGPKPMLKELARVSKQYRAKALGSLEEKMACGVGACLGCAVKTRRGFKKVCQDGPVFNLAEIQW
ncbi:dihydroorotate dehydrogenase electron transfer subunit [Candidatus Omnitrophota bacterium]